MLPEEEAFAFDDLKLETAFRNTLTTAISRESDNFLVKPSKRARLMGTSSSIEPTDWALSLNKRIHVVLDLSYDSQNDILEIAR